MKHLDGLPFRKISEEYTLSTMTCYRRTLSFFKTLPHCADITRRYCNKYCGILVVDGKYIKVKGYPKKIPVIYGIDYLTHDIPTYRLCSAEDYLNLCKFFESLRLLNYPLQVLISDDNENIRKACFRYYPNAVFQLCQKHYKDNIRNTLRSEIQSNLNGCELYTVFLNEIYSLFKPKRNEDDFNRVAKSILKRYLSNDLCTRIMVGIDKDKIYLLGYLRHKNTPRTNNIIESYNSHIQGRLKTIKGFKGFKYANLWLNAYFIRRRYKTFTDCTPKFKHLNGTFSIKRSCKNERTLPVIFR